MRLTPVSVVVFLLTVALFCSFAKVSFCQEELRKATTILSDFSNYTKEINKKASEAIAKRRSAVIKELTAIKTDLEARKYPGIAEKVDEILSQFRHDELLAKMPLVTRNLEGLEINRARYLVDPSGFFVVCCHIHNTSNDITGETTIFMRRIRYGRPLADYESAFSAKITGGLNVGEKLEFLFNTPSGELGTKAIPPVFEKGELLQLSLDNKHWIDVSDATPKPNPWDNRGHDPDLINRLNSRK